MLKLNYVICFRSRDRRLLLVIWVLGEEEVRCVGSGGPNQQGVLAL